MGMPGPADYPAPKLPQPGGGRFNLSNPKARPAAAAPPYPSSSR